MADRPAPGTADRPLRVVVLGSSTVFMVVPRATGPDEAPYGVLLDEALARRGVVSTTVVHSRWHTTVKEVLPHFEPWVRDHFPDVVVVNLGMSECQARAVPTWLFRHLITWSPGLSKGSTAYRKRAVPRLRTAVGAYQRAVVPHLPLAASRVRPVVFERAMARLVRWCARDLGAAVLLLDIDAPTPVVLERQPGLDARVAVYNGLLAKVAAGQPGTAVLATSQVVAPDPERLLPDGLHRSAEGHRLVAEAVADAIATLPRLAR